MAFPNERQAKSQEAGRPREAWQGSYSWPLSDLGPSAPEPWLFERRIALNAQASYGPQGGLNPR